MEKVNTKIFEGVPVGLDQFKPLRYKDTNTLVSDYDTLAQYVELYNTDSNFAKKVNGNNDMRQTLEFAKYITETYAGDKAKATEIVSQIYNGGM